ncbi:hypothetical protein RZ686_004447, partial [Enterobacter hormaechei]|nr:hypothetical protein [Enterobacter hormaechei]
MTLVRSEHELELAKELLDDIELSRLNAEALFLKAARLARLCGTEEFKKWIGFEIRGYVSNEDTSLKFMTKTGRWTNREEKKGYWAPIAQIEAIINSQTLKLNSLGTPNVSGVSMAYPIMKEHRDLVNNVSNSISTYSGIKSRALGVLHDFVSAIYYEKELDHLAESIFERYKKDIDTLISDLCAEVLQQIPSVVNRLAEKDEESVSQALTTVRRIIDSFADAIFPPTEDTYEIGGEALTLGPSRHLNRINVFVHQRIESKGRKDKIRQ